MKVDERRPGDGDGQEMVRLAASVGTRAEACIIHNGLCLSLLTWFRGQFRALKVMVMQVFVRQPEEP